MMEVECSILDITLPQDIIAYILTLMSPEDAVKTSILSRKWRYIWTTIPKLSFDYNTLTIKVFKLTLTNIIFHVLLLRTCPLLEFHLHYFLAKPFEMDSIILYLSRNNTLQRFVVRNISHDHYELPDSFFSFSKLQHLDLKKCIIKDPLTFNAFTTLRCLNFYDVKITPKSLKRTLTNCPLLEELYLYGMKENEDQKNKRGITQEDKLTFVELFKSSPLLENLAIEKYYMEYFATLESRLPVSLVNLKSLYFGVSFEKKVELLCCFALIKSSPNLTDFILKNEQPNDSQSIAMNSLDLEKHSNFKLDHLDKLKMKNFSNLVIEMDILKLILAQAPVLQKVRIELNENFPVDEELKISKNTFTHASPYVKFMVERPEKIVEIITHLKY